VRSFELNLAKREKKLAHFSDIIGHKEIIRALSAAIDEAKVGHAYLFTGPAGIGKKTLAKAFANRLLCHDQTANPDCKCPGCVRTKTDNHPDLITILPAGNSIKIEQLRQLQHNLFYRPLLGERKVCFFPDAELLTEAAANSFLKTLEEPPPGVVFLFTAVRSDLILPTIRSRCQVYQLFSVTSAEITEALVKRGIDPFEASERARLSGGLPGNALNGITEIQSVQLPPLTEIRSLGLLDLFKTANDLEKKERCDILILFKNWEFQARQELLRISESGLGIGEIDDSIYIIEKVGQAIKMIESNVNLRLVIEDFFLNIALRKAWFERT
jgi:DNA polymerase-3 subunit delta'